MKAPTLDKLPVRPPSEDDFTSRLRSPAVAARIGLWLGVAFGICFVTGLISHYAQNPSHPIPFPASPSWGYRVTQGLHVISGTASIPLLLVKLWTVYPKLFQKLPEIGLSARHLRELTITGLERLSIAVLVAASIFELVTGTQNVSQWYAWAFDFRSVHYALAWVAIGALLVHIAVKLPITRDVLRGSVEEESRDRPGATEQHGLSRRGLLNATWTAAGVAVLATAGSTVPLLRKVSVLAVRSGGDGHGGPPVNQAAREAGMTKYREQYDATGEVDYMLGVTVGGVEHQISYPELTLMKQSTETLPIACVEGWSASATWTGVRVRDLLDFVGAPRGADVTVNSLATSAPYAQTVLQHNFADDSRTLLALQLNGATLSADHGFPARIIAPDRPGVLQTKWVKSLEVQA